MILAQPSFEFVRGGDGKALTGTKNDHSSRDVEVDVRDAGGTIDVTLRVVENGATIQTSRYSAVPQPDDQPRNASGRRYTGEKISMDLENADLKDVLRQFAALSGMKIEFSPQLQGSVTIHVKDMPWDEAFDAALRQNGLTYELKSEGVAVVK